MHVHMHSNSIANSNSYIKFAIYTCTCTDQDHASCITLTKTNQKLVYVLNKVGGGIRIVKVHVQAIANGHGGHFDTTALAIELAIVLVPKVHHVF